MIKAASISQKNFNAKEAKKRKVAKKKNNRMAGWAGCGKILFCLNLL